MHLVGFTIEIYYDARSYKRQKDITLSVDVRFPACAGDQGFGIFLVVQPARSFILRRLLAIDNRGQGKQGRTCRYCFKFMPTSERHFLFQC